MFSRKTRLLSSSVLLIVLSGITARIEPQTIAKDTLSNERHESSLKALEGELDNEFEIRRDILRYIEQEIPSDNINAKTAAIKMAYYQNQVNYHSNTASEAIAWFSKFSLAMRCLSESDLDDWSRISIGIIRLMKNTPERDKHEWQVIDKFFGGRILGTGLNDHEERMKCKAESF